MNQRKARKIRKELGMTKENLRTPEYGVLSKVKKIVYFKDRLGIPKPVETERYVIVNKNKYFYRKHKKQLKRG